MIRSKLRVICVSASIVRGYLQLWGEYGFKLQAQSVLAVVQCRRRPLLVTAQVLQRLLSAFSGLELVHHLTRKQIGSVVTPTESLHAQTQMLHT